MRLVCGKKEVSRLKSDSLYQRDADDYTDLQGGGVKVSKLKMAAERAKRAKTLGSGGSLEAMQRSGGQVCDASGDGAESEAAQGSSQFTRQESKGFDTKGVDFHSAVSRGLSDLTAGNVDKADMINNSVNFKNLKSGAVSFGAQKSGGGGGGGGVEFDGGSRSKTLGSTLSFAANDFAKDQSSSRTMMSDISFKTVSASEFKDHSVRTLDSAFGPEGVERNRTLGSMASFQTVSAEDFYHGSRSQSLADSLRLNSPSPDQSIMSGPVSSHTSMSGMMGSVTALQKAAMRAKRQSVGQR